MSSAPVTALTSHIRALGAAPATPSPARLHEIAQQFEALLIGEMLKGVREAAQDSGMNGDEDEDPAGDSAMDMAQTQFAQAIAAQGGLGLSHLIETGLAKDSENQTVKTVDSSAADAKP